MNSSKINASLLVLAGGAVITEHSPGYDWSDCTGLYALYVYCQQEAVAAPGGVALGVCYGLYVAHALHVAAAGGLLHAAAGRKGILRAEAA